MKHAKQIVSVFILVVLVFFVVVGFLFIRRPQEPVVVLDEAEDVQEETTLPGDPLHFSINGQLMQVTAPMAGDAVSSPMTVSGSVAGSWYFEATFPIVLTDWDGTIIAEGYAEALSDWMTQEMVPFAAVLEFDRPYSGSDSSFMPSGFLILQKSNASGLPEHDDAVEVPVLFELTAK